METHGTKPDLENANWTLQGLRTSQIAVEESPRTSRNDCDAVRASRSALVLMLLGDSETTTGVFWLVSACPPRECK
jgi:hypothetical protein